ncbi:hypothetical protein BaRGS_00039384 [Batillaria attramentaria]|uniref:Uncharacterized protein n=1 Tax=Batillaria attramentaria TaxID=370345 RepID=A0ABD0J3C6_9CAEN
MMGLRSGTLDTLSLVEVPSPRLYAKRTGFGETNEEAFLPHWSPIRYIVLHAAENDFPPVCWTAANGARNEGKFNGFGRPPKPQTLLVLPEDRKEHFSSSQLQEK